MNEQNRYEDPIGQKPDPEETLSGPLHKLSSVPQPEKSVFPERYGWWDWWKCYRIGPVSGRYEGEMTEPRAGKYVLDLRMDIDPRYPNSPVMDRISGDLYKLYQFAWFSRRFVWRVFRESWIVDEPSVKWSRCQVEIAGKVRFWKGVHPSTNVYIRIPWRTFSPAGPAEVTFTEAGGSTSSYSCARKSDCFRDLTLEVDVCQSVNAAPILPSYDTHAHSTRPTDLPQRVLTIEEAYREAGIRVTIRPDRTIVDDSAAEHNTWSDEELHDSMEDHFSQWSGGWPKWQMWGLLAGAHDISGLAGIMFDYGTAYGGPGEPPERQGFAVFRDHSWFNDLPAGAPADQAEAWALRQFLYTFVHEAGHAFNLVHSWNKGRSEALAWMNYPQYVTDFWDNFRFRFDDEELIHIRHGDRASVIMGGDPWASGSHLEAPPGAMAQIQGEAPVELLLRSKEYFEFMEPVAIEFRLRNLVDNLPLELDTRLSPEYGSVIVYVRRPDGRTLEYAPILCKFGTPRIETLQPSKGATLGEDRYSEDVFLSYGKYGFYFDEPGEYLVRAVYQGVGDMLIPSNIHRVRIGKPLTKEEDRMAQDFFSYQAGMSLYLNGSHSSHLSGGIRVLESVAERYKDTLLGVKVATTLADCAARPFFRIKDRVLTKTQSADPEKALALTEPALALYRREKVKSLNIAYHQLVRGRAGYMVTLGRNAEAKKEVATLRKDLAAREVNESVINQIKTYEETI